MKYGRQCPGYREDTFFRDETKKVEELMKRTRTTPGSESKSGCARGGGYYDGRRGGRDNSIAKASSSSSSSTTARQRRDEHPPQPPRALACRGGKGNKGANASIIFVPETPTTTTKTVAAAVAAATPTPYAHTPTPTVPYFPLPPFPVADSTWEERAICYFFDQFTETYETDDAPGHLPYLPALYARSQEAAVGVPVGGAPPRGARTGITSIKDDCSCSARSCLRWAVDATSLITLGNRIKSTELTIRARRRYGLALQGLRNALTSSVEATKDETFAAVVLMCLFEDIAGERNGLSSSHTVGLEVLMQLRGRSQFGRREGSDLFLHGYTHMHVEFLVLGDKPRFNMEWALGFLDGSDPVHRLLMTAAKVSRMLVQIPSLNSTDYGNDDDDGDGGGDNPTSTSTTAKAAKVSSWIESCRLLDQELDQWSRNLPDNWLPLVVYSKEGHPLITQRYNWMTNVWNYYRSFRVLLQRLFLNLYRELPDQDPRVVENEYLRFRSLTHDLIVDICRSIPYMMEEVDMFGRPAAESSSWPSSSSSLSSSSSTSSPLCSSSPSSSSSSSSPPSSGAKPRIRGFRAHGIIWPLWNVLSSGLATPSQTQQIRSVLATVGSAMGIRLASALVEGLEEGRVK